MTPTELEGLVARLRHKRILPHGLANEAASALEAMGAELAAEKAAHWRTCKTAASEAEECDSLRSANEQLERDAGRYRWLRSAYVSKIDVPSVRLGLDDADQFDAAIDAALSAAQDKV